MDGQTDRKTDRETKKEGKKKDMIYLAMYDYDLAIIYIVYI